jgi:3-deoxy-D-manno-octulosonic-acid transferase
VSSQNKSEQDAAHHASRAASGELSSISRRSRAVYQSYNALIMPLLPALGAYTLWRRYRQGKSAASVAGLWGHVPPEVEAALRGAQNGTSENTPGDQTSTREAPRIWIHAVSVGETLAARPVARALRHAMPDCRIALSSTTDTGHETAQAALHAGEVDATFFFPLDVPPAVKRTLRAVRPHALLLLETELWPNVLHLARRQGARTFLVNGRVSDNLLQRAPKLGRLWRWMMANLDGLLMRSQFDAQRMLQVGAPCSRVVVTGDVKLDVVPDVEQNEQARAGWRQTLHIAPDAALWVAGSTHPGEEEMVFSTYATLRREMPNLRLAVAPRHIERVDEIEQLAQRHHLTVARRTQIETNQSRDVILLDTVGELSTLYAAADVAFVGGSLIERGGHNVLEPVLRGVPVVFGPHVANFRGAAAFAQESGAGRMVNDASELANAVLNWLQDDDSRRSSTENARLLLREHCGAAQRVAERVARSLEQRA